MGLKSELSRIAKLSNLQAALPCALQVAPVVAIGIGHLLAKTTNGGNVIEHRLLGDDETILLATPSPSAPPTTPNWGKHSPRTAARMLHAGWEDSMEQIGFPTFGRGLWSNGVGGVYLPYSRLRRGILVNRWERCYSIEEVTNTDVAAGLRHVL